MFSTDSIINSLDESIVLFDTRKRIIFINKTGEELFQKSSKDIIGRRISELVSGDKIIAPLISKTISGGRSFKGRSVTLTIDEPVSLDFSLSPYFTDGTVAGAILSLSRNIDIAEREPVDFDSIVYLLGSIAHEIKNPLGGIKGAAQLLRNKTQGVCIDEYVDMIIRETDRLNLILQDYLTTCKKPSFHPVNIHEVIEKALFIMHVPLQKKGLVLKRFYDPSLPQVRGDEGKLLQVLLNIIKNAVESMKKNDRLEVSTSPSNELFGEHGRTKRMALIMIRDTGKGITEKDLGKIFIPFYTKKKSGTGIGLAFSKKIIKDHGGFIKVKSQKNKGTCFSIYLPFEHNG